MRVQAIPVLGSLSRAVINSPGNERISAALCRSSVAAAALTSAEESAMSEMEAEIGSYLPADKVSVSLGASIGSELQALKLTEVYTAADYHGSYADVIRQN